MTEPSAPVPDPIPAERGRRPGASRWRDFAGKRSRPHRDPVFVLDRARRLLFVNRPGNPSRAPPGDPTDWSAAARAPRAPATPHAIVEHA